MNCFSLLRYLMLFLRFSLVSYALKGAELYGDAQGSAVVQTAWALLGLLSAFATSKKKSSDADRKNLLKSIKDGVAYLKSRQDANGDWKQEGISGVFNRACGITYTAYRNIFPIWALARFENLQIVKSEKKSQ